MGFFIIKMFGRFLIFLRDLDLNYKTLWTILNLKGTS